MARRRRSRLRKTIFPLVVIVTVALVWSYRRGTWPFASAPAEPALVQSDQPAEPEPAGSEGFARLAAEARSGAGSDQARPSHPADQGPRPAADSPRETEPPSQAVADVRRRVEAGLQARSKGEALAARNLLAGAVGAGLPEAEESVVRSALVELVQGSVFSPERLEGDPLAGVHVVQGGEVLARIARDYKVTADLLAYINAIADKNHIRIGQRLKVVQGPFHAIIRKDQHVCLVFLQDTLVAEYPVGLGEYGRTPTGEWLVSDKLENPTYYPPASRGGDIIAADDPQNPLGEYWVGLKGISGEAIGQIGYGIHGTIEPETVGRNVSMGCVRLLNEDMVMLFKMLTADHSHVVIK